MVGLVLTMWVTLVYMSKMGVGMVWKMGVGMV